MCELHVALWLLPERPAEEAELLCDQTGQSLVSGQARFRKQLTAAGCHAHKNRQVANNMFACEKTAMLTVPTTVQCLFMLRVETYLLFNTGFRYLYGQHFVLSISRILSEVWCFCLGLTFCFLRCTKCFISIDSIRSNKLFLELSVILSFSERLAHTFQETLAALSHVFSRFVFRFF